MGQVKTATEKSFDCEYFNPFPPAGEVNISIRNASFADIATVFSDPNETRQLTYGNQRLMRHTHLAAIVNEGDLIRVVLRKE